MRIMLPMYGDRLSPVLDVARQFVLVNVEADDMLRRTEARIEHTDPVTRAKRILEFSPDVLVCGAISWPLESMLVSAGVRVIPNICGPVEEVLAAFMADRLNEQAFLMPGCTANGRRFRQRSRKKLQNAGQREP
jgi:predicted Fe-Mo cluster-binding NifX family protein